jgi:hypothetical protein
MEFCLLKPKRGGTDQCRLALEVKKCSARRVQLTQGGREGFSEELESSMEPDTHRKRRKTVKSHQGRDGFRSPHEA